MSCDIDIHSDYAYEKAEREGWLVLEPGPNELFLDIDNAADHGIFHLNLERMKQLLPDPAVVGVTSAPSRSGADHRFHIIVQLGRAITHPERIVLQILLGSDRSKEMLDFVRFRRGDPHPTLFFEKP